MVKGKSTKSSKTRTGIYEKAALFFYDRAKTGIFFWLAIFLFGFFSYTNLMQRQGFPQVSVPISLVRILYFADDKSVVDTNITKPVVATISENPTVEKTTANSTGNGAIIVIQHTDDQTSQSGSDAVKKAIEDGNLKLPKEANIAFDSVDATKFNNKYDVLIAVSSDKESLTELNKIAEEVSKKLNDEHVEITSGTVIAPITSGFNPLTKKTETQQTQFDWIGVESEGEFNTNKSVIVGLNFESDTDIVAFNKKLTKSIDKISGDYENILIIEAAGFAENIEEQVNSLQKNLFEGLLIVILICLIFIGVRAGIIAAGAMLITLTMTLAILYSVGITLNTITLFGLVLCLGLIVDDIVIVTESIDTQRNKHKDLRQAVIVAISKIGRASTAGTLTTVLGFAPLLFIGGILGEFIRILPITIITSLLVSLVVSLTFVPTFSRLIHPRPKKTSKYSPFTYIRRGVDWLGNTLANVILSARTNKRKAIYSLIAAGFSLVLLLASGPVYQSLKFDIFPSTKDGNEIQIEYTFAPNTSIDAAVKITNTANTIISKTLGDDIRRISYQGNANERQAIASITLKPYDKRDTTSQEYVTQLEQGLAVVPGAKISVAQVSAGPPKERLPFVVQINADDSKAADNAAKNLVAFLNNKEIARPNGTTATVTETEYTGELVTITRINGQRIVQVKAGFDADDTTAIVQSAQKAVEEEFLSDSKNFPGLSTEDFGFDFGSESENQESFRSVLISLPILIILMYILLIIQFRSFVQPLLILLAVPFSFFGVGIALNLTENPISFFTMIGFFALIGISVNNTILLTDYANQERKRGSSPRQAMATAIKERIRPLITTTITSVAALIPLVLTDPFWESLAITLIGGLLCSALLVVISFPYYYLGLEAARSRLKLKFRK